MKCSRPPQKWVGDGTANSIFPFLFGFFLFFFSTARRRRSLVPRTLFLLPPRFNLVYMPIGQPQLSSHRNACVESIVDTFCISPLCITALQQHLSPTHQPLDPYAPQPCSVLPPPHPPPLRHPIDFFFFHTHRNPRRSTYSSTTQIHAHTIHVHTQHIRGGVSFPLRSRF